MFLQMLEITFPLMLISTCMLAQGRVKVERFNCSKPAKRKLRNEQEVVVLCKYKNSNAVLFSCCCVSCKNSTVFQLTYTKGYSLQTHRQSHNLLENIFHSNFFFNLSLCEPTKDKRGHKIVWLGNQVKRQVGQQ